MQVAAGVATWDDCALNIYSTVVSRAGPERGILDAGSKTLTSDTGGGLDGHGLILEHPEAKIARIRRRARLPRPRPQQHPAQCRRCRAHRAQSRLRRRQHDGRGGDGARRRDRRRAAGRGAGEVALGRMVEWRIKSRASCSLLATRYSPFTFKPPQRPPARRCARRKRRLQQITAGRRFPVEHLAGGEHAGQPPQHEIGVELVER